MRNLVVIMIKIDETDEKILAALKSNSRRSIAELSKKLGIARTTVQSRIDRLEDRNIIAGYGIRFGEAYAAKRIRATILAKIASRETTSIIAYLRTIPEVERAHTTSGSSDLIIEIAVTDLSRLDQIIDQIEEQNGFQNSETLVHLSTRLDRLL